MLIQEQANFNYPYQSIDSLLTSNRSYAVQIEQNIAQWHITSALNISKGWELILLKESLLYISETFAH